MSPTQFCDEKCAEGTEDGKETGQRLVVGVLGVVASWIMGIFFLSHFLFYKFSVMLFIMFNNQIARWHCNRNSGRGRKNSAAASTGPDVSPGSLSPVAALGQEAPSP